VLKDFEMLLKQPYLFAKSQRQKAEGFCRFGLILSFRL